MTSRAADFLPPPEAKVVSALVAVRYHQTEELVLFYLARMPFPLLWPASPHDAATLNEKYVKRWIEERTLLEWVYHPETHRLLHGSIRVIHRAPEQKQQEEPPCALL
jgi:hypothetical protein